MISTASALKSAIVEHKLQSEAQMRGRTVLAAERQLQAMNVGPLVEVTLRLGNISRGHTPFRPDIPGFTLHGTLQNESAHSWFDRMLRLPASEGPVVFVLFDGTAEENRLMRLAPRDSVAVAGHATIGLPGVFYETDYDRAKAPFALSHGRLL